MVFVEMLVVVMVNRLKWLVVQCYDVGLVDGNGDCSDADGVRGY